MNSQRSMVLNPKDGFSFNGMSVAPCNLFTIFQSVSPCRIKYKFIFLTFYHSVNIDIFLFHTYNINIMKHCNKRLCFMQLFKGYLNNRHLAEWRLLFFTIMVTVYLPICNVIRISFTPFRGISSCP